MLQVHTFQLHERTKIISLCFQVMVHQGDMEPHLTEPLPVRHPMELQGVPHPMEPLGVPRPMEPQGVLVVLVPQVILSLCYFLLCAYLI